MGERDVRGDQMGERGQSTVVGVVLVFGILVMLLLVLQTSAVPAWNQSIEYSHNERVQGEMELVRDDISRTATTGSAGSQTVSLGTRYPVRPFLFNPGPPSGTIRTTDPGPVTIDNATATGETGDYWDGSPREFDSRALVYAPDYNEYENAPTTVYESSVLYNRYGETQLPATGTNLVTDRRITLVTLDGRLDRNGQRPHSVDLQPLSAPTQVTTVRSEGPMVVTVPTQLSEETWSELLAEERVENGGYVTDIAVTPGDPGTLRVTLQAGQSYDLRMARIGVGEETDDPDAHYITTESPVELTVSSGTSERIVFEVRDRYNNPISGVDVNASVSGPGVLTPVDSVTDADGQAVFRYEAAGTGTATITGSFGTDPETEDRRSADVTIESSPATASGTQAPLTIEWVGPSTGEDDSYTLDTSVENETTLTVASSPGVEGLDVQYVVDDSSVGTVSPVSGTTDANGQDSITFTANSQGTVNVYAIGGGDVDVMTITVTGGADTPPAQPSNQPPTAEFTVSRRGNSAQASLDASAATDPDGTIVRYEWDVGDDGTVDYTGETTPNQQLPSGTVVTLTVTDDDGATDSVTRAIE